MLLTGVTGAWIWKQKKSRQAEDQVVPPLPPPTELQSLEVSESAEVLERLEQLEASVAALQKKEKSVPSAAPRSSTTTQPFQRQVLYLGSGETTQREWSAVGVEVTLDSADYPTGVTARFEAGLSILGGQAWARLKNKTTGSILSITEVNHGSSSISWIQSPTFSLHRGENTYQVEMRSTSGEIARLAGARIILED